MTVFPFFMPKSESLLWLFAQLYKRVTVSNSLRSLMTKERREQFALFHEQITHSLFCSKITSNWLEKPMSAFTTLFSINLPVLSLCFISLYISTIPLSLFPCLSLPLLLSNLYLSVSMLLYLSTFPVFLLPCRSIYLPFLSFCFHVSLSTFSLSVSLSLSLFPLSLCIYLYLHFLSLSLYIYLNLVICCKPETN